jgi:hypothetical protein
MSNENPAPAKYYYKVENCTVRHNGKWYWEGQSYQFTEAEAAEIPNLKKGKKVAKQ